MLCGSESSPVFDYISKSRLDVRQMSSAKCRSTSCFVSVHLIPLLHARSNFRMIQSMLSINNKNGERMQPCFTPVLISDVSVRLLLHISVLKILHITIL